MNDRVPGTRLFCHKMSLEQNSLACPITKNMSNGALTMTSMIKRWRGGEGPEREGKEGKRREGRKRHETRV